MFWVSSDISFYKSSIYSDLDLVEKNPFTVDLFDIKLVN